MSLGSAQETKTMMVAEQAVPAIVTLLRGSSDVNTLQFCLLALCNLLTLEENHLPVLQQGGLKAIISQAMAEPEPEGQGQVGIKESCALAFFNLSCGEVSERSERALMKTSILAMNQHPRNGYRHNGYIHY